MKRIGFITSGGDSPGMNAAIRAIVKTCCYHNVEAVGFYGGYQGLVENRFKVFSYKDVNNIIQVGGTILGSSRSDEFRVYKGRQKSYQNLIDLGIEGLIVVGGDGTLNGGLIFSKEFNFPIIGIPATIDNDLSGTDYSIGFDTAINTVVESVDKIRDTANSHHQIFFVEVMGRNSGFIALHAAIASGAEMVLIPEESTDLCVLAKRLTDLNKGERGSIFIVAEGEEYGGANSLTKKLHPYLGDFEVKTSVLGYIQRGGRPSAFDRILATRLGVEAVERMLNGEKQVMIGFVHNQISSVLLEKALLRNHNLLGEDLLILDKLLTHCVN